MKRIVQIDEKLPILQTIPLSFQHLFAMFGATVLVPLIFGINPAIALLMNGAGTLIYSFITKGGIPAYLGSSFAFIAPTLIIIKNGGGFQHAQIGYIAFGIFFILISLIIKFIGIRWIDIIMPPAVMGSVVAIIGLELAPVAIHQAGFAPAQTQVGQVVQTFVLDPNTITVSIFTLLVGVIGWVVFRGFFKIIPILIAVICGYIFALFKGMVDLTLITNAPWFSLPQFTAPVFDLNAILIIAPAFIVVLAEHIGHLVVTGNITERDLIKKPGLHLSLLGDGLSNVISGLFGSPPNTTYGENIGVMAITKVYSVWVIRGAAIIAIIFSCVGKFAAAISSIPVPVMGGLTILLYGVIASSGIRMLVEKKVDFSKGYNLVLVSVTFIIGVSNASISIGQIQLKGMALAAIVGVILSTFFYILSKLKLLNEEYIPNNEQ